MLLKVQYVRGMDGSYTDGRKMDEAVGCNSAFAKVSSHHDAVGATLAATRPAQRQTHDATESSTQVRLRVPDAALPC